MAAPPRPPRTPPQCGPRPQRGVRARAGAHREMTKVTLQLQWFIQAQFAATSRLSTRAIHERGIDLTIKEAASTSFPKVLADGQADFALAWVPSAADA